MRRRSRSSPGPRRRNSPRTSPTTCGARSKTSAPVVDDSPLTLQVGRDEWSPRNYEDRYEGQVTVRRALERSLNSAAVRVAQTVGYPAVIDTARALGIESPLAPVPAMALGAF